MEAIGCVGGIPVAGLSSQVRGLLDEMDAISLWVDENRDADPVELAGLWRMSLVLEDRLKSVRAEDGWL